MPCYFAIVTEQDRLVHDLYYPPPTTTTTISPTQRRATDRAPVPPALHTFQFVAHAALDVIEANQWSTRDMHLRNVDRYGNLAVSAWLTPDASTRLLLVHSATDEATRAAKAFLQSAYELFVLLVLCNPFHSATEPVQSVRFHEQLLLLARKHLSG